MRSIYRLTVAATLVACNSSSDPAAGAGSDAGTKPPASSTGESSGYFFGPIDAKVDVTAGESKATATVTAADVPEKARPAAYYFSKFDFAKGFDAATTYDLALGAPVAGQTCKVFMGEHGTGSALQAKGAVRVGCEWSTAYLSRSTDSSAFGSVTAIAVGGASTQIGQAEGLGEGRFVVFRSSVKGIAGNTNGQPQIFWRDRASGVTRLVSHAAGGVEGDGASEGPAISADGRSVVFASSSKNLVANDTNNKADIFVWSATDDSVTRVSVGPAGEQSDGDSSQPTVSGDGKVVAFATNSLTVVPSANDSGTSQKVVRIDRTTNERTIVSRGGTSGNPSEGTNPMLSEDGNRIVFQAFRDLTGDINPYAWDIFVYDHAKKLTWPVTLTTTGTPHDGKGSCTSCGSIPAISGDGKWVTFADGSSNLSSAVTDGVNHLWLVEVDACSPSAAKCHVVPIDIAQDGAPADTASPNRVTPLSYNGRYVSFASDAKNLGAPKGTYQQRNVFVFDRDSTDPASRVRAVTALTENSSGAQEYTAISREGGYVVFRADGALDPKIASGGAYAAFTGLADAFAWYRGNLD